MANWQGWLDIMFDFVYTVRWPDGEEAAVPQERRTANRVGDQEGRLPDLLADEVQQLRAPRLKAVQAASGRLPDVASTRSVIGLAS